MKTTPTDPKITSFLERLDRLDNAGKARLKRCAGQSLGEARREALGLFFSLLPPGVPGFQHDIYFLVATLYPLAENGAEGDLGASLRHIRHPNNQKGLDRRVGILLDADEAQLPFRLRRVIHLLGSNQGRVNWARLLEDLLFWSHPNRKVQRRWAQSYYSI